MRERNRQGIANWKLIQTMSGDAGHTGVPIGWVDFPMPEKTHAEIRVAASFCCTARLARTPLAAHSRARSEAAFRYRFSPGTRESKGAPPADATSHSG